MNKCTSLVVGYLSNLCWVIKLTARGQVLFTLGTSMIAKGRRRVVVVFRVQDVSLIFAFSICKNHAQCGDTSWLRCHSIPGHHTHLHLHTYGPSWHLVERWQEIEEPGGNPRSQREHCTDGNLISVLNQQPTWWEAAKEPLHHHATAPTF